MTEEPPTPKEIEVSMSTQNPQHSLSRVSFPKSECKAHLGATGGSRTDSQRNMSVSVIVKRKNPLDLQKMIGQHLTQDEFSEKYAADPANFDQLRDFAHKHGLTVDEGASSLARRTMVLRGPAGKMESPLASPSTTTKRKERNSIVTPGPSPCRGSMPNRLRRCSSLITIPLQCRTSGC
jgi:hypothetical protein